MHRKAANSRKWSRNSGSSASRQRELNRLNEIEKRRQTLELKQQNDLFDQMTFTVNNLSDIDQQQVSTNSDRDNFLNQTNKIKKAVDRTTINEDQVSERESNCYTIRPAAPEDKSDQTGERESVTHIGGLERRGGGTDRETVGCLTNILSSAEAKLELANINDLSHADGPINQDMSKQINDGQEARIANSPKQIQINEDQMIDFVNTPIPENKRVLCLIVRDKTSKMNLATSYFYPTYYLFLQAIVEIDDMNMFAQPISRYNGASVTAPESVENSFSASSSISADMLFIGSENGQTNQHRFKTSGNSYSDNENFDEADSNGPSNEQHFSASIDSARDNSTTRHHVPIHPKESKEECNLPKSTAEEKNLSLQREDLINSTHFPQQQLGVSQSRRVPAKADETVDCPGVDNDDDVGDDDDLDDDDTENEEDLRGDPLVSCSKRQSGMRASCIPEPNSGHSRSNPLPLACHSKSYNIISDMFDNDKNPYAGTYGVLLAGKRRKKGKTCG